MLSTIILSLALSLSALSPSSPKQVGAGRPAAESRQKAPYTLRLSAIYEDNNSVFLQLSNGTVWRYVHNNPVKIGWLIGDEILIVNSTKDGWKLENSSYKGSAIVQFVRVANDLLPTIRNALEAGGKLILTDGSEWAISWWNRYQGQTWEWKPTDRILISPLEGPTQDKSHLLINLDRNMHYTPALLIRQ